MTADLDKSFSRQNAAYWASKAARLCFAAVLVLIPFRFRMELLARPVPGILADYTDLLFYSTDIAVLAMLAMWALSLALAPRRLSFGPRHIWIPLVGLTLAAWISTASSYDALLSAYHGIRLLGLFWFYMYIVNEVRSLRWVLVPVGIQVAVQSVVALGQFMAQHSVGLALLGEPSLDPMAPGTSVITANGVRLLRAYGLSDHPNILGGCLAFGLLLLIVSSLKTSARTLAYAVIILGSAALVVTFSRAAWLAFAGGVAVIAAVQIVNRHAQALRRLFRLGMASIVLPAAIILTNTAFFGVRVGAGNSFSTLTAEQQSIGERFILIRSTLPILLDHPLIGTGIGSAPLALKSYDPHFTLGYQPPHLALFDAALETGALGAVFYLALLVLPFAVYIRRRRDLLPDPYASAVIALLLSIGVVGFFDYYTWLQPAGRLWQWLAWGLWGLAWREGTAFLSGAREKGSAGAREPRAIHATLEGVE